MRQRQEQDLAGPAHRELAGVLVDRLAPLPLDEGSAEVADKLGPLSDEEASRLGAARPGAPLPAGLLRKAEMSWEAPAEALIERGLLTSAESLAEVLLLMTAQVKAESISDPELGRAYEAIYRAFRNRPPKNGLSTHTRLSRLGLRKIGRTNQPKALRRSGQQGFCPGEASALEKDCPLLRW